LSHQVLKGQLFDFDSDEIWIKGISRVLKMQKSDLNTMRYPIIELDRIITKEKYVIQVDTMRNFTFNAESLPLTLDFYSNNMWTGNQSYVFHVTGNEENVSEWQNDNSYSFTPDAGGTYLINVKMRDEVFGEDVFSDTIKITIVEPKTLLGRSLLIIPLFLIFSLILVYFSFKAS